ncbi:MAG: hypothetical protein JXB10_12325 [Pirellulales bacterium]|nr:hypothetical protein [Pirellulales bacterium]
MRQLAVYLVFLAISATNAAGLSAAPNVAWDPLIGRAVLTNGDMELIIETKSGLNARSLRNTKTGCLYADRDYVWQDDEYPKIETPPEMVEHPDGSRSAVFRTRLGSLKVEQAFTLPGNEPGVLLEEITIRNPGKSPLDTADFRCGFAKCIRDGENWSADASEIRFCPIPYRRETNGQVQEYPLREVAERGMSFAGWAEPPQPTPTWGAEGWVWSKEEKSFLLAKYNSQAMEWSLMEPLKRGTETVVRFGGAGRWKHGHPENSARLESGGVCRFGQTRLQAVDGGWKQAYYAYRRYVEGKGCRTPQRYNPPVHWNELYDNQYYAQACAMGGYYINTVKLGYCPEYYKKNKNLLNELYSLELMKAEAAKARQLGCEALYLDPGWDTGMSQQIWDAARLGSMESFVKMMREEYGLKVSLWCSLAGVPPTYGDPAACPPEARVLDKDGKPVDYLVCCASPAFLDTKEKRLLELCRNGAAFLMFDSTQYSGPCYNKRHGHQIPSTREEHARALLELTRRVKRKYPHVLIEMHDFISGPCGTHYTPTYYGYAQPQSYDCLWGHEFMWNSLDDLLSRRAVSLYYYNLAYSIPLYLHISLKQENENALLFWWYASTCRHLGVGGKPGPAAWEACIQAMRSYLPLKRFYTQGVFYGIDETVHAHTLPDLRESVVNVFNLDDKPVDKKIRFRLREIGLPGDPVQIEGAAFQQSGEEVSLDLTVPARGHRLLKIHTMTPQRAHGTREPQSQEDRHLYLSFQTDGSTRPTETHDSVNLQPRSTIHLDHQRLNWMHLLRKSTGGEKGRVAEWQTLGI